MSLLGDNGVASQAEAHVAVSLIRQGDAQFNARTAASVTIHKNHATIVWAGELQPITYELYKGDLLVTTKL